MSDQSSPAPEQPRAQESGLKRTVKGIGGGLGCLVFLAALIIVVFIMLAYFFDNPTLWIAVIALLVAVSAYKANKSRR